MQAIVAQHLPKTTATITFDDGYPPMAPTRGQSSAARDVRPGEPRPRVGAGGRGRSVARRRRGRVVRRGHRSDDHRRHRAVRATTITREKETADLRMLPSQTKRAALLMYRLTQSGARSQP